MQKKLAIVIGALLVAAAVGCGDDKKTCSCSCTCDGVTESIAGPQNETDCNTRCDESCPGTWAAELSCSS